eukprot:tig00020675_g12598.t1
MASRRSAASVGFVLIGLVLLCSAPSANAIEQFLNRLRGAMVPPTTVDELDLSKYEGRWYEIASSVAVKATFQIGCKCVTATYQYFPQNQTIGVLNRCVLPFGSLIYAIPGVARVVNATQAPGKLEVRLFSRFSPQTGSKYWVNWLGPEIEGYDGKMYYSAAVVTDERRLFVWILSRFSTMSDEVYEAILAELSNRGFFPSLLPRSRQDPACDYDSIPPAMNAMFPNLRGDPGFTIPSLDELLGSLFSTGP